MGKYLVLLNNIVWGAPALLMILGVGLYLSVRLHFSQITLLPAALRRFLKQLFPGKDSGDRSSFRRGYRV